VETAEKARDSATSPCVFWKPAGKNPAQRISNATRLIKVLAGHLSIDVDSWQNLSMSQERRSHYRIVYPEDARPTLAFSGKQFQVIDVSEAGFRFSLGTVTGLYEGDEVSGTLTFPDATKEAFIIRGSAARIVSGTVSVKLHTPLPLRKIMAEQRRLIQKYDKFE
jgi:hypothetical protein